MALKPHAVFDIAELSSRCVTTGKAQVELSKERSADNCLMLYCLQLDLRDKLRVVLRALGVAVEGSDFECFFEGSELGPDDCKRLPVMLAPLLLAAIESDLQEAMSAMLHA